MTPEEYQEGIDSKQDLIVEALGIKDALEAICKALSYDQKQEIFDYIIRCYDLERGPEE